MYIEGEYYIIAPNPGKRFGAETDFSTGTDCVELSL